MTHSGCDFGCPSPSYDVLISALAMHQRQWNEWCDSRIAYHLAEFNLSKRFRDFAGIMGRECGIMEKTIVKEMRAEFDARINELSAIVSGFAYRGRSAAFQETEAQCDLISKRPVMEPDGRVPSIRRATT
jgi:hypothetical protein